MPSGHRSFKDALKVVKDCFAERKAGLPTIEDIADVCEKQGHLVKILSTLGSLESLESSKTRCVGRRCFRDKPHAYAKLQVACLSAETLLFTPIPRLRYVICYRQTPHLPRIQRCSEHMDNVTPVLCSRQMPLLIASRRAGI